jgi:ketosteroid isomerase-like protein
MRDRKARFVRPLQMALVLTLLGGARGMAAPQDHGQATAAPPSTGAPESAAAADEIRELIAKYAEAVNREPVDLALASSVWSNTPDVLLIYPGGEEHGWDQVKKNFYQDIMEAGFSQRTLTPRDIQAHAYGDSAWAEFSWTFAAKTRKDGSRVQTSGRETQIYRKAGPHQWVLVHVHYSAMPPGERPNAPDRP